LAPRALHDKVDSMLHVDAQGYRLPYPVRYPVELHLPEGFRPDVPDTWPRVDGRLEFVGGRLLYMPPCGDIQQDVATEVCFLLRSWSKHHPEYVVGGNEAGMLLGGETRGADAAVWRRADLGAYTGGFRRTPPLLAVEVAGQDEGEPTLREKARWYLERGVGVVWLLLPATEEALVLTAEGESRHGPAEQLPEVAELPALAPVAADFFAQLKHPSRSE
jgi:Uma2 family endonuclease